MVVGLLACKQLGRDLIDNCGSILIVQKAEAKLVDSRLAEDFGRLPQDMMVTLKWKEGCEFPRLLVALKELMVLACLDLRWNRIGDEGAGRLVGVLGEFSSLTAEFGG